MEGDDLGALCGRFSGEVVDDGEILSFVAIGMFELGGGDRYIRRYLHEDKDRVFAVSWCDYGDPSR